MKARRAKHEGQVVLEVGDRDEALLEAAGRRPAENAFKIKRILVPIDFSDCSLKALDYALPLAQQHEAALTLLSIVPVHSYAAGEFGGAAYAAMEDELRKSTETQLASLNVDKVRGQASAETLVQLGSPATEIINVAGSLPADLIVISTHGRTGLKHVVLGSVVEHVVRRAPCPVLVVREREHEFLNKSAATVRR